MLAGSVTASPCDRHSNVEKGGGRAVGREGELAHDNIIIHIVGRSSLESWSTIIRNIGLVVAAGFAQALIRGRISVRERKRRTRRLILIGSFMEHVTQTYPDLKARLMKGLDGFLERDRDRELFDLAPREASE